MIKQDLREPRQEHPEHSLDLALAGRLTPAERVLLDQHLAVCPACAVHLKVAGSSRSAAALGPHDDRLDRWAVEHVMAGLRSSRPSLPLALRWWRVSPRWGFLFAAVLLFFATVVSAKLWKAKEISSAVAIQTDRPAAVITPRRIQPSHIVAAAPAPEVLSSDGALGQVERLPQPRVARHSPRFTAGELFERARALGRDGKIDAALAIHLRLQRTFPATAEADLSSALAGRLLLDRDRPAEALAQFNRHLARGGAADEEALAGRAAALQKLGRHVEEATAWRALVAGHPGSVYVDRARARLRELSVH